MDNNIKVENISKISRQELKETLDTIIDKVEKEKNGFLITDEGKNDLILCPSSWIEPYTDKALGHIVISAIRYSMGRMTYIPRIVCEFTLKYLSMFDDNTIDVIIRDINEELRYNNEKLPQERLWLNIKKSLDYEKKLRQMEGQ